MGAFCAPGQARRPDPPERSKPKWLDLKWVGGDVCWVMGPRAWRTGAGGCVSVVPWGPAVKDKGGGLLTVSECLVLRLARFALAVGAVAGPCVPVAICFSSRMASLKECSRRTRCVETRSSKANCFSSGKAASYMWLSPLASRASNHWAMAICSRWSRSVRVSGCHSASRSAQSCRYSAGSSLGRNVTGTQAVGDGVEAHAVLPDPEGTPVFGPVECKAFCRLAFCCLSEIVGNQL